MLQRCPARGRCTSLRRRSGPVPRRLSRHAAPRAGSSQRTASSRSPRPNSAGSSKTRDLNRNRTAQTLVAPISRTGSGGSPHESERIRQASAWNGHRARATGDGDRGAQRNHLDRARGRRDNRGRADLRLPGLKHPSAAGEPGALLPQGAGGRLSLTPLVCPPASRPSATVASPDRHVRVGACLSAGTLAGAIDET